MIRDLQHGLRVLMKNPGFTLIAVISIAIGVGANAAMFSVADGLVFRPLPVPRAREVISILGQARDTGFGNRSLSYPDYLDLRDKARSFDNIVAYCFVITSFTNRAHEPTERKVGMAVSGNFFEAMEVHPRLGRALRADESEVPGRNPVVVLDHDEWRQHFAADPSIVDKRITLGGVEFTVVGVAPEGFTGIDHDVKPAFYIPIAMYTAVQTGVQADLLTRRDSRVFTVKGRLTGGVTINQARQDIEQLASSLAQTYPDTNRNRDLIVKTEFDAYRDRPGGGDTNMVVMLMTLALLVLAIACANIAGLLASRAPARARELALRLAVGAGRFRVLRQLVTESLLLATGGGLLGLLLGYAVINAYRTIEYPTDIPLKLTFDLDTRALIVGILVAAGSAVLSSLLPAWRATRADLVPSLKDAAGMERERGGRLWGRNLLVCAQVALALMLVTVTIFMYRAFNSRLTQGPGFRTEGLIFASFDPSLARYSDARAETFFRDIKDRAASLPGVTSVALASTVPMRTDNLQVSQIAPEGFTFAPGIDSTACPSVLVDEGYFDTTGIRIVAGRGFRATDNRDSPQVAIVNQRFAARYWPGQDVIKKRVNIRTPTPRTVEIIGVAADSRYFFIVEPQLEFMYFPHAQSPVSRRSLILASSGPAAALAEPLRALARSMDPQMPVLGLRTMEDYYASRVIHISRLIVGTVGGLGAIGVLLAVIGLYGLVAYSVTRRTREIGIRIAVGAAPASVLRMVLRRGMILAGVGIVLGIAGSIATSGLLSGVFQNQMGGHSVWSYVLAVPTLIAITLIAAYIPARRAARTDPLRALRQD
ncbi:MAG TPA: ABC transporter permease [Vicinamibacterales bacterium]|nr:ABC transporter permease [Vicinamibacterales bacterium]